MAPLSPTQQSIDVDSPAEYTHRQWLISIGFKHNVSSDFKAWIMYNQPDIYSPFKKLAIPTVLLKQLKDQHSYAALKGKCEAPWFHFLHKLKNNKVSSTQVVLTESDASHQLDEDWESKYKQLKKTSDGYFTLIEDLKKKQLSQINLLKQQHSDELLFKISEQERRNIANIRIYETYVTQCYHKMTQNEKQIKLITVENNSYKEGFSNISSSTLSQETLTTLQQHYETLSFPKYSSIICPITQEIMVDPVIAFDGQTYEKSAIEEWFKDNNKSPSNGTELSSRLLISNHTLRKLIAEIVQ